MSMASWNLVVPSLRSRNRNSVRKRRAAKSKSAGFIGPSESANTSSRRSSISPRSVRLPPPLPPRPPFPKPPLPARSRSPRSKPNAAPKRSEPPRSKGPSFMPPMRSMPPLPFPPFSPPLLPPCAKRTTKFLPSNIVPCKASAFWACSSVRKVTKQTPFEAPSGVRRTFKRSTSPTSSKKLLISSSGMSPTFATNTCLGLGSRGPESFPPLSPNFDLPLPLPFPRPLQPPRKSMSSPPRPGRSKSSMRPPPPPPPPGSPTPLPPRSAPKLPKPPKRSGSPPPKPAKLLMGLPRPLPPLPGVRVSEVLVVSPAPPVSHESPRCLGSE
mmetsp:Transcript_140724/g.392238  ORF Transcript_140724/g.392238 Transcript_140724/m.392238 type:complete len:326 (-) Transcript_140724:578-1555(-)